MNDRIFSLEKCLTKVKVASTEKVFGNAR